jgi:hypothetical protein
MDLVDGANSKAWRMFVFRVEGYVKQRSTGTKPTALVERRWKSKGYWIKAMGKEKKVQVFALCVENKDCEDLEKRKIYQVLPDEEAEKEGYLRVIDESGEDYLYPQSYFVLVQLPREAQEALRVAI